jgi:predicted ATPase
MIIDRVEVKSWEEGQWPFTIPAVRAIARTGLDFERAVTFLVGENGSGKSTIVEAIAEAFKIDVRGGHGGRRYSSTEAVGVLSPLIRLLPPQGALHKTKSFFLRTETAKGVLEFMSDVGLEGYGERNAAAVSHGESFLQVLSGRFTQRGLYLLDEPEAPFSFRSCLSLLAVLADLARSGSQIICATHSPLLTALPGAHILELSDEGIDSRHWEELEVTTNWRHFLDAPDTYLRHLLGEVGDSPAT